jgi:SWIB/MDM2 domain
VVTNCLVLPLTHVLSLQVLQYLKEIISDEKLYDDRNASIVICDRNLEAALDVKALHLMELR